ncbi:MAG: RTX family calcium-binding protein [Limisphaerales bacterium]|nr:MAG: RTX family calcium-binding protein [Limisphaerales bacterium]KAG0510459.1 MAG: RTX family calcium-binding protein [Limisphaerales bacterium]TXT52732.1 MAG: RTX family calcium-binding protein [Limisphaerales bacterium]
MRLMKLAFPSASLALLLTLFAQPAAAADWPMWRADASRSAASPEELPAQLHLQWTRHYSPRVQVWDDPLNHDLMPYDRIFEPVVMGGRVFIGFNDTDKVVALDLRTGKELWAFYTDGPVRFAPVAWREKVYFTSDDGHLYCVSAADGQLKWKLRGGPSEQKVLGNQRVISAWPARGGPVLRDGRVYFAASIWPFMGTFIYAVDAETGKVAWVNDGTGAQFIKQPHNAPSFAGVAPQGALVATKDILLVPGGRSIPAAFDRHTGEFLHYQLATSGKGNGGSFVAASETEYYVHTRLRGVRNYDLKTGKAGKLTNSEPVLDGAAFYTAATNRNGAVVRSLNGANLLWEVKADASGDLIKAGRRLYAAGSNSLTAIEVPTGVRNPRVAWTQPLPGGAERLLAANGVLLAVSLDGRIRAFGGEKAKPATLREEPKASQPDAAAVTKAKGVLSEADASEGHALWFGVDDGAVLQAVLADSKLHVVAVDPDAAKVDQLRRRLDAAGLYGTRATVHIGDPVSFKAPPYLANLVVVGESFAARLREPEVLRAAYNSLRPYGGTMWLPTSGEAQAEIQRLAEAAKLERAVVRGARTPTSAASSTGPRADADVGVRAPVVITREGPLPDSADWTHQYGDIGNTVKSDDARVRAPLGLLWFGGNSNLEVLPRHGHGPPEQVIGGRMILQGMSSFSARDVYTGRQLWKTEFKDLGTYGIYYDKSYTNTPLSTAYNQKHIPGANGRGANYIATEDSVYVVVGSACQVLDARTGKLRQTIQLTPRAGERTAPEWGFIGLLDNVLLAGDGFAHYTQRFGSLMRTNTIEDFSASAGLVALDRHTGKMLWRVAARHSFLHNGIVGGNGRIYCLDKLPTSAEDKLKRRGSPLPTNYRIAALDAMTGKLLWEETKNIFGTWLSYSKQHDVLLLAGAKASDRLRDEVGEGMAAYRGAEGKLLWQDLKRKYTGPCILHNELILTSANSYQASSGAFNLLDGKPHLVRNPLTGKLEPWRVSRAYGCNNIVASENLLTFRSGAAGFYDLLSQSGTGNLGGFKSGCTANLVVANGVLNAPDYTRTCTCAYQNQTSLALVHMPEMELWAYTQFGLDATNGDRVERVGINFGAPGDRRAEDGTMWLEHPSVGGDSPGVPITVTGKGTNYFRRHASQMSGAGLPWVMASGLRDCETITVTPEIVRPTLTKPPRSKEDDEDEGRTGSGKFASAKESATTPAVADVATVLSKAKKAAPRAPHPPVPYTVRLHFAEPEELTAGERVFSVALQGRPVLTNFDIVSVAGGAQRGVVKEFKGVVIQKDLKITLTRAPGTLAGPLLCGVELIAETLTAGK